jgi:hypothetical protein
VWQAGHCIGSVGRAGVFVGKKAAEDVQPAQTRTCDGVGRDLPTRALVLESMVLDWQDAPWMAGPVLRRLQCVVKRLLSRGVWLAPKAPWCICTNAVSQPPQACQAPHVAVAILPFQKKQKHNLNASAT